jgi:hypothetical protein
MQTKKNIHVEKCSEMKLFQLHCSIYRANVEKYWCDSMENSQSSRYGFPGAKIIKTISTSPQRAIAVALCI